MSYDIFLCRFEGGEQRELDFDVVHAIVDPYVTSSAPDRRFLQLAAGTDGGRADLHLTSADSIMISHFGGDGIMNVLSELLRGLRAVLLLPGGTVVLNDHAELEHLAQKLKSEWSVVVAPTGGEITEAIRAS
ncbi:hypothetical protein [Streptomyces similanensis]|uniref:Uncharacterized protein n=1 Tax=Streptomyces similanensis TaxID=1274988 RepID=A0ABP9KJK5_9ACTN